MSKYIYIAVYTVERSEFRLNIKPTYHPTARKGLMIAHPMTDGKAIYDEFKNEFDFRIVSFMPWWSQHEEKTVVMLVQGIDDKMTFYLDVNEIPMNYRNVITDENQMYALSPSHSSYINPDPSLGNAYYVRLRSNYNLSGFLDRTPQKFYFWALT